MKLLLCFSLFFLCVLCQLQTCSPFNYTNTLGKSRTSVDIYQTFAIVGYCDINSGAGMMQIFQYMPATLTWSVVFTASGASAGDQFGYSVAISNQFAFVGAPGHNSSTGAVYLYQFSGTAWTSSSTFTGSAPGGSFGYSVAVGDAVVVIGAPFINANNGQAYILKQATGWAISQTFNGQRGAAFGYSVALSNSNAYLGIGEPGIMPPSVAGAAYAYTSPSGGPYNLANSTTGSGSNFYGGSVGVYGNALSKYGLIVGIPLSNQVEIFDYDSVVSTSTVSQVISLTSASEFGVSVAIDRTFSGGKPLPVVGSPSSSSSSSGFAFALSSPTGVGNWNFATSISGTETAGYSVGVSAGTVITGDEQSTFTIWCSNVV